MTSGGSSRTTVSAVRLTITPRSSAGRHHRRRVARQLDAPHQAGAADFLDDRVPRRHRAQPPLEVPADAADVREQPAADQLVEDAQRRAAGEQIAAVGAAVIAVRNRVRDFFD